MATILEDNQSLSNKPFMIPNSIMKHLKTTLSMYGKYKDNDGYKRLNSLVNPNYNKRTDKDENSNQISYGNLKRIKHDFEAIGNNPKDLRYILNGGEKMYNWVNSELERKRNEVAPVNAVKKSDNIKKSGLKPSDINGKQLKPQKLNNASITIKENKEKIIYLTENQLKILKEYRNQLYIPFNGGNGLHDKPCIEHFMDWIEENSKKGFLPSAKDEDAERMYFDSREKAADYYFDDSENSYEDVNYDFISTFSPTEYSEYYSENFIEKFKNEIDRNDYSYIIFNIDFNNDEILTSEGLKRYNEYKNYWFNNYIDNNDEGEYFYNVNYPRTKDSWVSDFTEECPFKRLGLLSSPSV